MLMPSVDERLGEEKWLEVACEVPLPLCDLVAERLAGISGSGVCTENRCVDAFSADEIPALATVLIKAYFPGDSDRSVLLSDVRALLDDAGASGSEVMLNEICSEDWANAWKVNFRPIRVGRRLLIVPSWENVTPADSDILLRLDPGMAFGTGGH